jgi:hypothetical protein
MKMTDDIAYTGKDSEDTGQDGNDIKRTTRKVLSYQKGMIIRPSSW